MIEAPPSDARVLGWAAFKAGVRVYFFWHAVHWRHNHQKKVGDRNQNVWADPVTFDARNARGEGDFANGEGVLLYPGTDRLHPDQDRGIAGPISTLRMANLRRGLQDHLYLTLARQRGHDALVDRGAGGGGAGPVLPGPGQGAVPRADRRLRARRLRLARALAARRTAPRCAGPLPAGRQPCRRPAGLPP